MVEHQILRTAAATDGNLRLHNQVGGGRVVLHDGDVIGFRRHGQEDLAVLPEDDKGLAPFIGPNAFGTTGGGR